MDCATLVISRTTTSTSSAASAGAPATQRWRERSYLNLGGLIAARARYARVDTPVTLVYGDQDWSRRSDRQANIGSVPGANDIVLRDTGHFTALEAPDDVARILRDAAE